MSLSFPASPTNGQQYQGWVWNSSVGAWQPNYAAGFVTSFNGRTGAVVPQTTDATSGERVLLQSSVVVPASPVATVDWFRNFATDPYDQHEIEVYGLMATADGAVITARFSTDGATFDAGTNYNNVGLMGYGSASVQGGGGNSNAMVLGNTQQGTGVGTNVKTAYKMWTDGLGRSDGVIRLIQSIGESYHASTSYLAGTWVGSYATSTAAIRGIRLMFTSGNIYSGTFKLYGIVK